MAHATPASRVRAYGVFLPVCLQPCSEIGQHLATRGLGFVVDFVVKPGVIMQLDDFAWRSFSESACAVSYTHLDVYKRQGVATRTDPAAR